MIVNTPHEPGWLQRYLFHFDYLLFLFVLAATGFGLLVLDGATYGLVGQVAGKVADQARWWGISMAVFALAVLIPYSWLKALGWVAYLFLIGTLFVLFCADHFGFNPGEYAKMINGAYSWFDVPVPGLGVVRAQPSEFAKIALVLVLSHWLAWRHEYLTNLWECIVPVVLMTLPVILICAQPDFGSAAIFLPLPFILLFVAGLPWRIVWPTVVVSLIVVVIGMYYLATAKEVPFMRQYALARIQVFLKGPISEAINPIANILNPPGIEQVLYGSNDSATVETPAAAAETASNETAAETRKSKIEKRKKDYQLYQAELALGSGQLTGKGWRNGTQTRMQFLPDFWTDFVFSSLGEQFGLVGCLGLLGLYLLIMWRAVRIAILNEDPFGRYLVCGLISIVLLHVYLNVGMSTRLLPQTGLPLPLVTYGGSFLATNYLIFGLIANVSMRR
ncbi:MAG TPA: rod shape-determining protein RodA [Candidatus Sumerlaeota bacterium]|nr:rod shape-determining protein RodA [Candidatus Sumerlaeota bacterium]HPS00527.1 rod shape-determining protein RodA [Candidatus Sumerlaeota bacterium]